jgi:hypothetical protein
VVGAKRPAKSGAAWAEDASRKATSSSLPPLRRYERGSILIASNRSVGERGTVLGDAIVATAILDRLLHHSQVINIRGDSYRLHEKRRADLFKPTGQGAAAVA